MKEKTRGFTLLELLIVVFIIGLLSSMLVINMRQGESQYQLQLTAQEIAQNIRKAQGMALTSFKYKGSIPSNYGIFFEKQELNSYRVFADTNGNNRWDSPLQDREVENVVLERGIEIDSLSQEPRLHITFSLPDGFTNITPSANSATITVKISGGTCPQNCKDIIIERTGRVSVQ